MIRFLVLTILFVFSTLGMGATILVPADQPSIQQGIDAASGGDTVLVAPGTYIENIDFIGKAITVKSSGGADVTVIDGNSSNPVVTFTNAEGSSSIIEGFTLRNGSAAKGGGIFCHEFCSPTIRQNIIRDNNGTSGGGIYCEKLFSTISRNVIIDNTAGAGGGLYCWFGAPVLTNNTIVKNSANNGGGIYFADNGPDLFNNTIAYNTAVFDGGGIIIIDSNPTFTNGILWGNTAASGSQIKIFPGGSVTVSSSDVQGGWGGIGNINIDPVFVNPGLDDFHLTWFSPCINMGTNFGAPVDDIDGDARPFMGTVDMGSDEVTPHIPLIADVLMIPAPVGGTVQFTLDAGPSNGDRTYLLLASVSGTVPGTLLPGGFAVMPLNFDSVTDIVLGNLNTPVFQNFLGKLNRRGIGYATLNTHGPVLTSAPITVNFAYTLIAPWDFVSNPVPIEIVP